MREPYLNFLVQVLWPNGRLQREYTLLLDPPLYTAQSVTPVAVQQPVTAASSVSRTQPPAASGATAATSLAGNEYQTTANDNLWDIASRARAGGSVHQAMLAIQDLNPNAFIDNNINRMKSGQVLRLPDAQQIQSRTQSAAIAQVNQQTAAWREASSTAASARQLDASKRSNAAAVPARIERSDNLKLVADGSGKASAGSELKSRIADLQSQLDKLQRLVELKNDQMAKLQAYLAAQDQAPAATPEVSEDTAVNEGPAIP
jgi:pilus assembly protein FimV